MSFYVLSRLLTRTLANNAHRDLLNINCRLLQSRSYSSLKQEDNEEGTEELSLHASDDSFTDYTLNSDLIARLGELGFAKPFGIQSATLPFTLKGHDVIGKAVTGSGKSLAFTLPILQKLSQEPRERPERGKYGIKHPRAIIISPTRELCLQSHKSIAELAPSNVKCVAVYGGSSITKQISEMSRGVDIICATPGRLNDLIKRNAIGLNDVCFLCLDEADELLTPNFKDQIEWVLRNSPADKQMMMFSATMPSDVRQIANDYMNSVEFIDITAGQKYSMPSTVQHECMRVYGSHYNAVVENLLEKHDPARCIIFCETKRDASNMASTLKTNLYVEALHSDLSQSRRDNIMQKFRKGRIKILVATDVAARGLDVPEIDLVIQAGTPKNGSEYYVHRSGRTGRAGRNGLSILLHTGDKRDRYIIHEIEKIVKLTHVECSNYAELQEQSINRICESLQSARINYKESELLKPILERYDEAAKHSILVAALVEKMRQANVSMGGGGGGKYNNNDDGRSFRHNRHDSDRRGSSSYGGGGGGGGRHNQHYERGGGGGGGGYRNQQYSDENDHFSDRRPSYSRDSRPSRYSQDSAPRLRTSIYEDSDERPQSSASSSSPEQRSNNVDFGEFVSKMQKQNN